MSRQGIRISNVKGGEPGSLAPWPLEKILGLIVDRGDGLKNYKLGPNKKGQPNSGLSSPRFVCYILF